MISLFVCNEVKDFFTEDRGRDDFFFFFGMNAQNIIFFFQLLNLKKYCLDGGSGSCEPGEKKVKIVLWLYMLYPTLCSNGYRMW